MKQYKAIDFYLQTSLIIISIISTGLNDTDIINPLHFIIALGVAQAISLIVHLLNGPQPWKKRSWRKIHLIGTLIVFVILAIVVAIETLIIDVKLDRDDMPAINLLFAAAGLSIFLIIFYAIISWAEWKKVSPKS